MTASLALNSHSGTNELATENEKIERRLIGKAAKVKKETIDSK